MLGMESNCRLSPSQPAGESSQVGWELADCSAISALVSGKWGLMRWKGREGREGDKPMKGDGYDGGVDWGHSRVAPAAADAVLCQQ